MSIDHPNLSAFELKFLVKALVDKQYLQERISKLEKILKDIETVPPIDCIQDPLETLKRIIHYAKYAKKASYLEDPRTAPPNDCTEDETQFCKHHVMANELRNQIDEYIRARAEFLQENLKLKGILADNFAKSITQRTENAHLCTHIAALRAALENVLSPQPNFLKAADVLAMRPPEAAGTSNSTEAREAARSSPFENWGRWCPSLREGERSGSIGSAGNPITHPIPPEEC